jgi:Acetyltransferases
MKRPWNKLTVQHGVRPKDVDALYRLEKLVYSKDMLWSKAEFKDTVLKNHTWAVWDQFNEPVALMVISMRRGIPYIDTIEVSPKHQGQGIASSLMALGEGAFRDRGYETMRLEVAADNPAKDIYAAKDYEVIRRRKNYYSKGHDALVMEKVL